MDARVLRGSLHRAYDVTAVAPADAAPDREPPRNRHLAPQERPVEQVQRALPRLSIAEAAQPDQMEFA